jgi:hypothetical protein
MKKRRGSVFVDTAKFLLNMGINNEVENIRISTNHLNPQKTVTLNSNFSYYIEPLAELNSLGKLLIYLWYIPPLYMVIESGKQSSFRMVRQNAINGLLLNLPESKEELIASTRLSEGIDKENQIVNVSINGSDLYYKTTMKFQEYYLKN